jgi:hypothetical protein
VSISGLIAANALFLMMWVLPIAQQPNYSHTRLEAYAIVFALVEMVALVLVYRGKAKADGRSSLLLLVMSISVVLAGTVAAAVLEGLIGYFIWALWHRIAHS